MIIKLNKKEEREEPGNFFMPLLNIHPAEVICLASTDVKWSLPSPLRSSTEAACREVLPSFLHFLS